MGRMLSALLVCALLACGPVRAEDSNTGDAATKTTPAASNEKSTNSPAAKSETKKAEATKPASDYREEIEELRQLMREQAQQLSEQQKQLELLREQLSTARKSEAPAAAAAPATSAVRVVTGDMATAIRPEPTTAVPQDKPKEDMPASIKFKGITLTPGGFFAAESVWRQRAISADINTPFTSTPFSAAGASKVSEFNFSGRPSRISMLAEGKLEHAKFTGYYEMDFQSAAVTSNNRQSNSYAMRQRQIWGRVALDSGWAFSGGQMWSLVTETKKGLENRTELPPMTIDHQYNVGFSWARQNAIRVVKSFNADKLFLGFSVENAQTTFGGRGLAAGTFFINAPGQAGGLFNAFDTTGYTTNKAPDFILKAAVDPGWGHYELFGIVSLFRARVYPCGAGVSAANPCPVDGSTANSSIGAFNDSRTGGGVGANLRAPVLGKYGDFGIHFLGGDGVGRYSSAGLADVTARPNGTLAPIRGGSALATIELHPSPKLDVYLNYGLEYAFRTWYNTSTTAGGVTTIKSVGYGSPFYNNSGCAIEVLPGNQNTPGTPSGTTCTGDIRNMQEGTLGFWHKIYQGPRGGIRWGVQYSYFVKNTWSGNNNTPANVGLQPKAINNMVMTSFRYVLP